MTSCVCKVIKKKVFFTRKSSNVTKLVLLGNATKISSSSKGSICTGKSCKFCKIKQNFEFFGKRLELL